MEHGKFGIEARKASNKKAFIEGVEWALNVLAYECVETRGLHCAFGGSEVDRECIEQFNREDWIKQKMGELHE